MIKRRIKFYVVHASAEENQNGTYHKVSFDKLNDARKEAKKTKDDFVVIEKHHERLDPPPSGFFYRHPELQWEVDHELGGVEVVE